MNQSAVTGRVCAPSLTRALLIRPPSMRSDSRVQPTRKTTPRRCSSSVQESSQTSLVGPSRTRSKVASWSLPRPIRLIMLASPTSPMAWVLAWSALVAARLRTSEREATIRYSADMRSSRMKSFQLT